jgi:hypothetical protein
MDGRGASRRWTDDRQCPNFVFCLKTNKFIFFSIRNSQFANKIRVCFVLIRVVFSAPFNRARIHLFFQFSKPIPDFQLSKRSRNHEINPQKEGLIFEDFDRPQK